MNGSNPDAQCWSDYWGQGALTTFSEGNFEQGYEGPIVDFWKGVLESLPADGRILDLATGNGALPLLFAEHASSIGKSWHITGVDFARLEPGVLDRAIASSSLKSNVQLLGETPMESTGLPDGSYDLITSQFGIEYGDLPSIVSEARRLLRRAGSLALVMHHPESKVVQFAERDFLQTRMVIEEERFDRKVTELAKATASASDAQSRKRLRYNPEAERWRQQVNRSIARLSERLEGKDATQMLRVTQTFLRIFADLKNHSRQEKLDYIWQYRKSMQAYSARMEAMAQATLGSAQFERFLSELEEHGFTDRKVDLVKHHDGNILGRCLTAVLRN